MLTHLVFELVIEGIIFVNKCSKRTLLIEQAFNESWVSQQATLPQSMPCPTHASFSLTSCLGDGLLQVLYVAFKDTSPMTMNIFVSFVAYLQNMFITCIKDQPTSCNKTRNTTKDKVVARVFKLDPSF